LEETTECPNKQCLFLAILGDASARASVAKYLTWFERRNKYKQDSIDFKWFRYSSFPKPRTKQKRTKNKILLKEYAQAEGVSARFGVDLELASDLSPGIGVSETAECWEKV
jgi:hypothetical protein